MAGHVLLEIPVNTIQFFPELLLFSNTYLQYVLFEWNLLGKDGRDSQTLYEFKRKLLVKLKPDVMSTFSICDTYGDAYRSSVLAKFSPLNEQRFRYNYEAVSARAHSIQV